MQPLTFNLFVLICVAIELANIIWKKKTEEIILKNEIDVIVDANQCI